MNMDAYWILSTQMLRLPLGHVLVQVLRVEFPILQSQAPLFSPFLSRLALH